MSWPIVELSDVATLQAGIGFPLNLQGRSNGAYPFAKVGDISRCGRIGNSTLSIADHYVDQDDVESLRAKLVPRGSILFAKIGEAIRQNHRVMSGCDMLIDNNAMAAIPSARIEGRFLYYFLKTIDFYSLAPATTVPALRKSDLERLRVPLPPLDEQKRIAAILDQADGLRRKRREAIARLETLTQSIFYEMFGDWSHPKYSAPLVKLGDNLDFLTSGSRGWAEYYSNSGSLFLRIQNVKRDELNLMDIAYVNAPNTAEANRTKVRPGDVLLSITADLGRTAVIPENIGEAFINQHLSIIRTTNFDPRFLSAALASPAGQRDIHSKNREGVKAGLNFNDIRNISIPNVDMATQKIFARKAKKSDEERVKMKNHLGDLDSLFASLQHRAFRGEL